MLTLLVLITVNILTILLNWLNFIYVSKNYWINEHKLCVYYFSENSKTKTKIIIIKASGVEIFFSEHYVVFYVCR